MTSCVPEALHAHANALDHTALVAGYIDDRTGAKRTLTQAEREGWAADAAAIREAAHQLEQRDRPQEAAP